MSILNLIHLCGVRSGLRQIKKVCILQQNMIRQRFFNHLDTVSHRQPKEVLSFRTLVPQQMDSWVLEYPLRWFYRVDIECVVRGYFYNCLPSSLLQYCRMQEILHAGNFREFRENFRHMNITLIQCLILLRMNSRKFHAHEFPVCQIREFFMSRKFSDLIAYPSLVLVCSTFQFSVESRIYFFPLWVWTFHSQSTLLWQ